jgi:LytR cell envelope-related transcriptional attenuator
LAVILGIVGLQILDDSSSGGGSGSASSVTTGALATTTTGAVHPPAEVRVKVYNASGVQGVAQTTTDTLKAKGYNMQAPATLDGKHTGTAIQCKAGFEREGAQLVAAIPGSTQQPFPSSAPADSDTADCIVVIGSA